MSSQLKRFFRGLLEVNRSEVWKVLFLSLSFFLIIGGYTIAKELKDAVFTNIVGVDRKYLAYAKIFSMFILIPAIFIHSKLIDTLRRHQLLYLYSLFFSILGIVFTFFLGHPTIGLANTLSSPYRIFGWLFYFFVEGFSPLLISLFWAFTNSVTRPDEVKNNYTTMIAGSKLGGILSSLSAWLLLRGHFWSDTTNLQILLGISSGLLLLVPLAIYGLITKVAKSNLHGYEAAYLVEKEIKKESKKEKEPFFKGMISGLILFFKYPYVMGIFGMSFFFELINQVIKVENIVFGKTASATVSEFTGFLMWQAMLVHLVGFFVVAFGTRSILQALGERRSLMLIPTLTGLSIIVFLVNPSYVTAIIAFVVSRSVNYAFAVPLRESLYIPTVKEIKFKTKSWIDGIGSKFAKMSASSFNMYIDGFGGALLLNAQAIFFSVTILLWFITAYALGRRFERSVKNNEVIGSPKTI